MDSSDTNAMPELSRCSYYDDAVTSAANGYRSHGVVCLFSWSLQLQNLMDLPPDKAKLLRSYDHQKKWEIVCDQEKMSAKQAPSFYLSKLSTYLDPKAPRSTKVTSNASSGSSGYTSDGPSCSGGGSGGGCLDTSAAAPLAEAFYSFFHAQIFCKAIRHIDTQIRTIAIIYRLGTTAKMTHVDLQFLFDFLCCGNGPFARILLGRNFGMALLDTSALRLTNQRASTICSSLLQCRVMYYTLGNECLVPMMQFAPENLRRRTLGNSKSTQVLRDLEISLRTNNIEWVREFLNEENKGLEVLIEYLSFQLEILK
ncbi:formin protein-like [Tropilaelaps mercedesae]|uniref:Formin protein-like n=1 Tax=Tropilaelaps mercedesae TaxID=418985 RepID=A0A1V9Y0Z5_9ACAR|nr:formin protein-like [Tropilaelaps mercedesae]